MMTDPPTGELILDGRAFYDFTEQPERSFNMMQDKVIGILGGMGPEATWDLFGRITKLTRAERDADHLHVIIDSNPKIPDRTNAIISNGPSPVPAMIAAGKNLEGAGADFIVIPCMTAHFFIEQVQESLHIPIINGFELIQHTLANEMYAKMGVIATTGSLESKLYERYLDGVQLIIPDPEVQEREVMDLIYGLNGIKAGSLSGSILTRLNRIITRFQLQGAEAVIAGCTEIGLVLRHQPMPLPVIDPLDLLAEESVRLAKNISVR
jgi:aspartate racemase